MKRQAKSLVSMRRLVWAFASRTYHIVGNLMSRLLSCWSPRPWFWSWSHLDQSPPLFWELNSVLEAINLFIWVVSTLMWPCHKFTLNYWLLIWPGLYLGLNETLILMLPLCNTHGNISLRISEQSALWAKFTTLLKGWGFKCKYNSRL